MRNRIKLLASLSIASICLGTTWGQSQTNITLEDMDKTPVKAQDTVLVAPKATEVVSDQTYSPANTSTEVGSIPPGETKSLLRRKEAKKFSTAGFGPAGFGNIDEKTPAYDLYAGRMWEVNKHAAIKALGEVASDFDNATMANMQLGANLYALPSDISPYIGGGLGLGYGTVPGDQAFGFNVGASVGALLFRTSSAQMNVEGSAQMMLSELNDNGSPSIYAARLGVLF